MTNEFDVLNSDNQKKEGYPVTQLGFISNLESNADIKQKKSDKDINIRPASALVINPDHILLKVGDTINVSVISEPFTSSCPGLIWYSSDESVVTVRDQVSSNIENNSMAEVIGVGLGEAVIKAVSVNLELSCELAVKVMSKDEEVSTSFDYVFDEESWNASYTDGGLKLYYEANPDEDLWNESEDRAANFNDRVYVAENYSDAAGTEKLGDATYHAGWGDIYQSIKSGNDKYYILRAAEIGSDNVYEAFEDAAGQHSAGFYVKLISVSFPDCIHCWKGAVNAPGAAYPWIIPHFDDDVDSKIRFEYEGKESVMPWGDRIFGNGEGHRKWGCASVSTEFNDNSLKIVDNGGEGLFDITKFKMILIPEV